MIRFFSPQFIVFQDTFIWISLSFVLGKRRCRFLCTRDVELTSVDVHAVYINALLASLNARKYLYHVNIGGRFEESLCNEGTGPHQSMHFKTLGTTVSEEEI